MNLDYKNIVVAGDGSEASDKAFKKSLNIVKNNDARLIISHVVDSRTFAAAEAYDRTLAERADEYATERLDGYVNEAKTVGVDDLTKCDEYGSPRVKIAKDNGKKLDTDLKICATTRMKTVERFLIRSVSENLDRHALCDVLVVR